MASEKKPGFVAETFPGLLVCVAIALPAWLAGKAVPVVGGPILAILLGALLGLWLKQPALGPGIRFSSKKVLQYAIVLLGFDMNLANILAVGGQSLLLIVSTIAVALVAAYLLTRALRIPANTGVLVGVGSAICGGSAIAATAPVIGADDEDVASAISTIFLFNVIAALIFPSIGRALGMSDIAFGLWAGTAVNDTSSVVAAATTWSNLTGTDTALSLATVVKLTRTLAIIPITFVLAIYTARKKGKGAGFSVAKIFPWFILFFLLASVLKTVTGMPDAWSKVLVSLGKFLIIVAMAAIGLNTNPVQLVKKGGKPILLGFCCWVLIALVALGVLRLQGYL